MEQLPFLSPNEEGWAEISPNISILNETNYIGTCLALYNARHSMWNEIFSPFRGSIHFSVSSPRGEFSPRNRIKGTVSSLPFPLTISSQEFQSTCIQFSISRIERSIVFIYLYDDDSILSFFFFYLIRFLNSIDKNYLISIDGEEDGYKESNIVGEKLKLKFCFCENLYRDEKLASVALISN